MQSKIAAGALGGDEKCFWAADVRRTGVPQRRFDDVLPAKAGRRSCGGARLVSPGKDDAITHMHELCGTRASYDTEYYRQRMPTCCVSGYCSY